MALLLDGGLEQGKTLSFPYDLCNNVKWIFKYLVEIVEKKGLEKFWTKEREIICLMTTNLG